MKYQIYLNISEVQPTFCLRSKPKLLQGEKKAILLAIFPSRSFMSEIAGLRQIYHRPALEKSDKEILQNGQRLFQN